MGWALLCVGLLLALYTLLRHGLRSVPRPRARPALRGRTAIVTGGSSGIGAATALELARCGARVILATRNALRGEAAASRIRTETGNEEVRFMHLDLASLRSVRAFVSTFLHQEPHLHLLINNAGVSAGGTTEDGFSLPFQDYCDSKLANVLHARELATREQDTQVTCYAVHPGFVNTALFRHAPLWLKPLLLPLAWLLFLDPSEGAQVVLDCATRDGLEPLSGRYFTDSGPQQPWPRGRDDRLARALWESSERLVGLGGDEVGPSPAAPTAPAQ
ncbi:dehydrogenase/reductase SDR family member 13 isoform X2 [Chiroxiphia lanceolata]|uniref:dehydrogenase/reductase SDR family member 13 isoform X2 n=1 Tax=Chiroxiphia lanceolata TaxID=296741 RepID=UPI0013CEE66A|nr:dehydrogenase/reductase SDR family member 13 isoform X2 [Chiroxiphia lanceolata]